MSTSLIRLVLRGVRASFLKDSKQNFLPDKGDIIPLVEIESSYIYNETKVVARKFSVESPVPTVYLELMRELSFEDQQDFYTFLSENGWKKNLNDIWPECVAPGFCFEK